MDLKKKTAKSFFWVTIDTIQDRGIQFVVGIILARLLLPSDFGIVGLTYVFISFSLLFIDSGFSFALIRKKNINEIDYYTVFWFNFIASLFFFVLLWFLSPFIADFYNQEILKYIIRVIGINLLINAFSIIQNVNLRRELKFKELTFINIISKSLSGILAIILAFKGVGIWSLVVQNISSNLIKMSLMLFYNKFIPLLRFSRDSFKELFSFSSKLLYSGIFYSITENIYPLVIGKFFNISDVGFFNRAQNLQQLPVLTFTGIVQSVTLPAFSKIQDDDKKLKSSYKKAIKMSIFAILFPLTILIVGAYPIINLLLTSKWLPSADMLRIFAIGGIFYPLSAFNVNIIGIKGRSDYVMYSQYLKDGLTMITLLIGSFFGIYGLVLFFSINGILCYIVNAYFANKVINYSVFEQIKDVTPFIMIASVSGILGYLVSLISSNDLYKILMLSLIVALSYIFIIKYFYPDIIKEIIEMVKLIFQK